MSRFFLQIGDSIWGKSLLISFSTSDPVLRIFRKASRFTKRFERGHRTGHNLVTMCLSSSKAIRCHSTFDRKIPYLVSFFHVFRTLVQLINPVPDCEFVAHVRPIWGIFYDETYVGTSEAYNLGKPMERWQFVIAYCGDFTDPEFRFSIRLLAQTLFSP